VPSEGRVQAVGHWTGYGDSLKAIPISGKLALARIPPQPTAACWASQKDRDLGTTPIQR
jgi:hypothetical protein